MTLKECINNWIAQYEKLKSDLNVILKNNSSFRNVLVGLSKNHHCSFADPVNEYAVISLMVDDNEMRANVYVDENEEVGLSDVVEIEFSLDKNIVECRITELNDFRYFKKLKERFGKYFDKHIYMVSAKDMTGEIDYDDCITVYDYEDKNEAFTAARELAKLLNDKYPQCFCITLYKGFKRLLSNEMAGDPFGFYTISTKSKGETMRARRVAGYTNLEVDEYIESISKSNNMENNEKKTILIMNIVKLDNDGNLDCSMERYNSIEEAEKVAEERINEWLSKNEFTLDEQEADENGIVLCEREDYGHFIEVCSTETIAEMNIYMKEFEV